MEGNWDCGLGNADLKKKVISVSYLDMRKAQ